MKIYAVALGAINHIMRSTMPGAIRADNDVDAKRKAMEQAYREYPKPDGWVGHYVDIVQVPDEWIDDIADC